MTAACESVERRTFDYVVENAPRILEALAAEHDAVRRSILDYLNTRTRSEAPSSPPNPVRLKVITGSRRPTPSADPQSPKDS